MQETLDLVIKEKENEETLYSINEIWSGLFSSKRRCLDAAERLSLTLDESENITRQQYELILNDRLGSSMARAHVKKEARLRLENLTGSVLSPEITKGGVLKPLNKRKVKGEGGSKKIAHASKYPPQTKKEAEEPVSKSYADKLSHYLGQFSNLFRSEKVTFLFLVMLMVFQIGHLADMVNELSDKDGYFVGILFGVAAESTAIVVTVNTRSKRWMIWVYAILQVWINVLFYEVFTFSFNVGADEAAEIVSFSREVKAATLAFMFGFVSYSYSEIYALAKEERTSVKEEDKPETIKDETKI